MKLHLATCRSGCRRDHGATVRAARAVGAERAGLGLAIGRGLREGFARVRAQLEQLRRDHPDAFDRAVVETADEIMRRAAQEFDASMRAHNAAREP